jgi:hypothetical protein
MRYFKHLVFGGVFLALQIASAQKTIHNFSYVVVPTQFYFQKQADQYQLNSLAKFLFEKEGVQVFLDTEKIPQVLLMQACGGLELQVLDKSSFLKSKLRFELRDCENVLVFSSELGQSDEKEFKKSFHECLRNAFESFKALNYAYVPWTTSLPNTVQTADRPEILKKPLPDSRFLESAIYANEENLEIVLTEDQGGYVGHVIASPFIAYAKGDLICKLFKTSLPNVFKVQWKDVYGNFIPTIGYFQDAGSLKIDFETATGISVMSFSAKKTEH